MELFRMLGKVAVDNGDAVRSIDETTGRAESARTKMGNSFQKIGEKSTALGQKMKGASVAAGGLLTAMASSAETTREYRTDMGKLETAFTTSGHSAGTAKQTYEKLQAVLGETDVSVEAANHLAKLCNNEKDLNTWTDICTGVFATFGDSLPIEGLTEAANETAKVGQVTGPLADALNWAGISEDEFNEKLEKCSNEQERQALITSTLNGLYADAADTYKKTNSSVMDANRAQEKLTASWSKFGAAVEPIITKFKFMLAAVLGKVADLDRGTQTFLLTLVAVVAAAAPILTIFGHIATGIGSIITAAGKFSSVISGVLSVGSKLLSGMGRLILQIPKLLGVLQTAGSGFLKLFSIMAAHPAALIIAAIAALVAGFVYLWNHCEGFRQFWINLWANIKEIAITVWNAIKDFFSAIWQGIKSIAETIWNGIKDFFSGLWEGIKNAAEHAWNALSYFLSAVWSRIKAAAETIWNSIKNQISAVMNGIQTVISTVWNAIKTIISTVLGSIKTAVSTIWNGIKTTITTVLNGIRTFISSAWNQIKSVIITALNNIKSVVSSIWNQIKTIITNILNGIKSAVTSAWNSIKSAVSSVLSSIKSTVSTIWNGIKSFISNVMNGIKSVISGAWSNIKSKISSILSSIKSVFINVWNGIKNVVTNAIISIKNTVSSGINNAKSIATGALNGIKSAFSNIFGGCISIVRNAIDRIKGLFNFNWSLPRIKLPHFSINGKFSLNPPQVPHLEVEWYKKGAVLTEPTVFGLNPATGKAMAGGEAGAEAVAPIDTLMEYVQTAVQGENEKMVALLQKILEVLLAILGKDTSFYLDGKEISKIVNKYLGVEY